MVFRSGYEASLSLTLKIVEGFFGEKSGTWEKTF